MRWSRPCFRAPGSFAKQVALAFALVTLLLTIAIAAGFDPGSAGDAQFQYVEQHEWIPSFGVSYALGVDGISSC